MFVQCHNSGNYTNFCSVKGPPVKTISGLAERGPGRFKSALHSISLPSGPTRQPRQEGNHCVAVDAGIKPFRANHLSLITRPNRPVWRSSPHYSRLTQRIPPSSFITSTVTIIP